MYVKQQNKIHTRTEERKKNSLAGIPQQLSPTTVGPQIKKKTYERRIRSKAAFDWLCQAARYVAFGTN